MKVKDFLSVCNSRTNIKITSKKDEKLNNYKILTEHFNYPCFFDKYGRCLNYNIPTYCCTGCNTAVGYIGYIRPNEDVKQIKEVIKRYARLYNKETGFWRRSKGCALPRNMRSTLCVGFVCTSIRAKFESVNSIYVIKFLKLLKHYNHLSTSEKIWINTLYDIICDEQKGEKIL